MSDGHGDEHVSPSWPPPLPPSPSPPFPSRSLASRPDDTERVDCGWREGRRGREETEGLAFNYLGFPRQEAIHLRVYAIFGGEIANGSTEHRFPKYYDNIYPAQRGTSRWFRGIDSCWIGTAVCLDVSFARGGRRGSMVVGEVWSKRWSWRDNGLDGISNSIHRLMIRTKHPFQTNEKQVRKDKKKQE